MKTRYLYLATMFAALLFSAVSCRKLDEPVPDTENTINALKCYVYYDSENWNNKVELDALSGTYNAERGIIQYTFPADDELYNSETLTRCRLEASIPSTARLVEVDAMGEELGHGIGGMRSLYNKTIYFKVIAANGEARSYQATFKVQ
ncbi:MAG TPA: hypothetical protein H9919_03805 [Candidatus Alistipes excrementipullorum]|nr:hypothetical protein [Candidatus Alistipes excrementipullorum]